MGKATQSFPVPPLTHDGPTHQVLGSAFGGLSHRLPPCVVPLEGAKHKIVVTKARPVFGDTIGPLPARLLSVGNIPSSHQSPPGYYLTMWPREAPWAVAVEAIHQVFADATSSTGVAGTLVIL